MACSVGPSCFTEAYAAHVRGPRPVTVCDQFKELFEQMVAKDYGYKSGEEPVAFDAEVVRNLSNGQIHWQFYHNPKREGPRRDHAKLMATPQGQGSAPHLAQAFHPTLT